MPEVRSISQTIGDPPLDQLEPDRAAGSVDVQLRRERQVAHPVRLQPGPLLVVLRRAVEVGAVSVKLVLYE
jgi:hypothetical protein